MMREINTFQRRGAAYLIALLAGSIVTVTGLAALSMTTSRTRTTSIADHATRARSLASTGLEHALCAVSAHLDDGGTRRNIFGSTEPSITLDGGTLGWSMRNIDGTPVNNSDQPLVVRSKGQHGPARYGMEAVLTPSGVPYDVLETGMYAGGDIDLGLLSNLSSDQVVGAIGDISIGLTATGNAPLESAGSVGGLGALLYAGSKSSGAPQRRMPDVASMMYYLMLGESIDLDALPTVSGIRTLERVLLSPGVNPYGETNELGIYIIDCEDKKLAIQNVRIVGTLILLNATDTVLIGANTLIEPAFSWMPSLLVHGSVTFAGSNNGPSESSIGVNLNPPHTPYQFQSDLATDDDYPGQIRGVVYVTDDVTFSLPRQNVVGTLIAGDGIRILGSVAVNITYDPGVATLPPFGFFEDTGGLAIDPSTVVWGVPN